jgi:hypothetical protein
LKNGGHTLRVGGRAAFTYTVVADSALHGILKGISRNIGDAFLYGKTTTAKGGKKGGNPGGCQG